MILYGFIVVEHQRMSVHEPEGRNSIPGTDEDFFLPLRPYFVWGLTRILLGGYRQKFDLGVKMNTQLDLVQRCTVIRDSFPRPLYSFMD